MSDDKDQADKATEPKSDIQESSVETPQSFQATGFDEPSSEPIPTPPPPLSKTVSWEASEYIAHHKSFSWYLGLFTATAVIAGLVHVITEDRVALGAVIIVSLLFGIFALRKPEVLEYTVDNNGITIGNKRYIYEDFKSFSVHTQGALPSIFFWPTKRFMPGLTIYFPPEQTDDIVEALSSYIPHEEREPEAVERLMRRIRF